jgi:hypothetical protein
VAYLQNSSLFISSIGYLISLPIHLTPIQLICSALCQQNCLLTYCLVTGLLGCLVWPILGQQNSEPFSRLISLLFGGAPAWSAYQLASQSANFPATWPVGLSIDWPADRPMA